MKQSIILKIIMILVIFTIVPMLLFSYLYSYEETKKNQRLISASLYELLEEKKDVLLLNMQKVENEVISLSEWIDYNLKIIEDISVTYEDVYPEMDINDRDQFNSGFEEDNTALYVPYEIKNSQVRQRNLILMGLIKSNIKQSKKRLSDLEWVYFITSDNLMLLSPNTDLSSFGFNHDFSEDVYFKIARNINQESTGTVWTKPYYDWLGKGWTITCSRPVYYNKRFIGVVCADMSLDNIKSIISDLRLSNSGNGFLIDKNGNVIYHPEAQKISKNKGQLLSMNLITDGQRKKYIEILNKMLEEKNGENIFYDSYSKSTKLISYLYIDKLQWYIGIEANLHSYIYNSGLEKNYLITIIMPFIFTFMILGIYLFFRYSQPLVRLTHEANLIKGGNYNITKPKVVTDEISVLENAFYNMAQSIEKYTKELENKNNQISAIFNSFPGAIYIVDNNYNLKLVKEIYTPLTTLNNCKTNKICFSYLYDKSMPCEFCPFEGIFDDSEHVNECSINSKFYNFRSYPVKDKLSEISEWVVIVTDITEQKIIKQQINQSEKLARIGQIVTGITHELRNPLSVIKGSTHLLNIMFKNNINHRSEEYADLLDKIDISVEDAEMTINSVLDFAKPSIEEREKVNLYAIIKQIIILENQMILSKRIDVTLNCTERAAYIEANANTIKHIFINLLTNAIDAVPIETGNIVIEIVIKNDTVIVRFCDNGYGINEKDIDRIFEPFYSTKGERGHGLGLWFVKLELQRIDAEIEYSRKNNKTIFTITFANKKNKEVCYE